MEKKNYVPDTAEGKAAGKERGHVGGLFSLRGAAETNCHRESLVAFQPWAQFHDGASPNSNVAFSVKIFSVLFRT